MSTLLTRYIHRAPFQLDAFSVDFPAGIEPGQNRAPFQGILTRLNEPSTRPPNGSNGHRVLIPSHVAQSALQTLTGMPINCAMSLRDHDKKFVIGQIDRGEIQGNDLVVFGLLYDKNFPDEVEEIRQRKAMLGMSYEISGVEVEDIGAPVWTLTHLVFTGAAILAKDAAAYSKTAIAAQAAETEEGLTMAVADELFDKLATIDGKLTDILAQGDDEDDEEARKHEEDAKRHDDEARKHEADAAKARDDDDEDDAKRHDEEAAKCRDNAAKRRADAMKKHEDAAKKKMEAGNEAEAKHHEAEAKRLADEAAKCKADEEARAKEEDAAKQSAGGDDDMANMLAMFLRGMGYAKKQDAGGEGGHIKMLKDLMQAMTYPMTYDSKNKKQHAAHDDEAEDVALFRKMIQQYKGTQDASTDTAREKRETMRRLRRMEASMQMLTDTVGKLAGLMTDTVANQRTLGTDVHRAHNGGPVRRTMAAGGEVWATKQTQQHRGEQTMSLEAQEQALKGLDSVGRIAKKYEWQAQGITLLNE